MLTKVEMQKILDQVNKRFDYLNNKIEALEAQLKSQAKTPVRQASKKVEEKS